MGNKSSTTDGTEVLPGVVLTQEAQEILSRQLSRKIVWRYKGTKLLLLTLSLLPLTISAVFAFVAVRAGVLSFRSVLVGFVLIGSPIAVSAWLFNRARRY